MSSFHLDFSDIRLGLIWSSSVTCHWKTLVRNEDRIHPYFTPVQYDVDNGKSQALSVYWIGFRITCCKSRVIYVAPLKEIFNDVTRIPKLIDLLKLQNDGSHLSSRFSDRNRRLVQQFQFIARKFTSTDIHLVDDVEFNILMEKLYFLRILVSKRSKLNLGLYFFSNEIYHAIYISLGNVAHYCKYEVCT